jgi:hypothetical protein
LKTKHLVGSFRKNHGSPETSMLKGAGTVSPFRSLCTRSNWFIAWNSWRLIAASYRKIRSIAALSGRLR